VFTPFVNGAAVTDGPIDVAALVGHRTAYLISACVEAADGLIDITFTHEGGDGSGEVPILNSLTVDNAPAYTIEGPTDQAVYTVGDTLHVRWDANVYLVTGTEILLSPDLGESWLLVNTEGAVFPSDPAWGDYPFVLPLQLAGVSLVGVPLSLKLNGYNGSFSTVMQGTFSVLPGASPVRNRTPGAAAVPHLRLVEGRRLAVGGVPSHSPATLEIHALNGALVCRRRFTGGGAATFSVSLPAGGTYIAVLTAAGTRQTVRLATR
jgi:hypothetical protein